MQVQVQASKGDQMKKKGKKVNKGMSVNERDGRRKKKSCLKEPVFPSFLFFLQ